MQLFILTPLYVEAQTLCLPLCSLLSLGKVVRLSVSKMCQFQGPLNIIGVNSLSVRVKGHTDHIWYGKVQSAKQEWDTGIKSGIQDISTL